MAETTLPITGGITYGNTTTDSPSAADWNAQANAYEARMATAVQGPRSARPAPGKARRRYDAVDEQTVYVEDGTNWWSTGPKFWTRSDHSNVTLAANNNGNGASSWSVTTPAGSALLTVAANLSTDSPGSTWEAQVGLLIDGVDRVTSMTLAAGIGATFHGSIVVPLTAATHALVPRYVTGGGGGHLVFVSASFTLLMGQEMT